MFIGSKNLSYTYMPGSPFATEALRDISFSLGKGCFTLLIGPSGSGKSTLIQHLNGLLKPTSGQVYFDDKAIGADKHELLMLRRRIGLVFQMPEDQFFSETVFDEVAFAPRNLGLPEDDVRNRVVEALEKVGLDAEEYMDHHPFQLSAGQKRLVAVAAVLSLQPEVLVLDEPTAGLDAAGQNNLFQLLEKLNRESGLTVIISTHHLDEAAALADTVLVLHNGKLVMSGSRNEVFSKREELFELGLELPALTELMNELAKEGLPVNTAVYTLDDAKNEINKVFRWHSK